MDQGLDTGPMLMKRSTAIDENEDIVSLHDRMAAMGAQLLAETLDGLRSGMVTPEPQDDCLSCYAPLLKKEDGQIDWNRPAREIHNQVRGLMVWPGAYTSLNGQQLRIYRTLAGEGNGAPGEVIRAAKGTLEIACGSGSLMIRELQLAGKKRLDSASFLAGCQLTAGTVLGDDAMQENRTQ